MAMKHLIYLKQKPSVSIANIGTAFAMFICIETTGGAMNKIP